MKKNLYRIGMLAVAACAFIACEKETEQNSENKQVTHIATITLNKEAVTKTALVEGVSEASYVWADGDDVYLHVYENGTEGTITDFVLSSGNSVATLTVSFEGSPEPPYTYTAKYAKTLSGSKNPKIPEIQAPTATSFDPAADIMVSKATDDVTNVATRASELTFTMGRVVSVNKMTLTGLNEGELVSKVEFTLGTSFLGGFYTGSSYGSSVKTLTANYVTPIAVGADGKFPVYFTCAPVDAASITSVVVTTDQKVYTKSSSLDPNPFDGKTISFAVGTMKRFNMAMGGYGEAISTGTDYTLVESQSDLFDGATYIIVGNADDLVAMGTQNGNNRASVGVTASSKVINIDNTIAAATFTIEKVSKGYTILDNSTSKYLYTGSTSANRLQSTDTANDNATWNISISDGVATITNVGNTSRGVMCLNGDLFNCYASLGSYKTLSLYVDLDTCIPTLATPSILAEVQNTNEIYVTWNDVANADSYTVSCTGETDQVIGAGVEEATFSGLSDGTYTITVTAVSNNPSSYQNSAPAVVENLVVGDPKGTVSNPYTAGEIITNYPDGSGDDSYFVSGTITEITEVSTAHGNATYTISDGVNSILVYRGKYLNNASFASEDQINVNDEVIVYGKIGVYNSTPQLAQGNYLYSINGKSKVLTAGSLTATPDNANKQITVTWGAATGTESAISYVVNCGTQSYNANAAGSHTFTMADYGTYSVSVVASASDACSATTSTSVSLSDPNGGETTASVTIATYANTNSWSTGTKYSSIPIDGNVTASVSGTGSNSGKYYTTSPAGWRFYQSEASTTSLTISAANNHTIKSVTITYANKNNGTLVHSSSNVSSGTSVTVNAASVSFTVGNTGSATNGQIAVSAITVVYN